MNQYCSTLIAIAITSLVGGLLFTATASAQAPLPDDNWYAGGPDGYSNSVSLSETWHTVSANDDEQHFEIHDKTFTLRRHGPNWFLIPDEDLEWTPANIKLEDYPTFVPWGDAAQWRWISTPPVKIKDPDDGNKSHDHHVCIGYPSVLSRRDHDRIEILVVDASELCHEHDFKDHPGHSGAER